MATGWTPVVGDKCNIKQGRYPGKIDKIDLNKTKPYHVKYHVEMSGLGQTITGENSGWFSRAQLEKRSA